jgi:RNA polymerase primary sigma factor
MPKVTPQASEKREGSSLEALSMPGAQPTITMRTGAAVAPHEVEDPTSRRGSWDPLRRYIQEAVVYPLLTREEERAVARKIQEGDPEARERMIVSNLRLVMKIAKEYEGCGLPTLDIIELGNVGLMKAVDRFNPDLGAKFSTYAVWWIRQGILYGLSTQSRTIRLPTHKTLEFGRLMRTKDELQMTLGREPTDKEIADEAKTSPSRVRELFSLTFASVHLDAPMSATNNEPISSTIADDESKSPSVTTEHEDLKQRVKEYIRKLSPREQIILTRRFGLDGKEPETLDSIGADFGVTRERIRQVEAKALMRLRQLAEDEPEMKERVG